MNSHLHPFITHLKGYVCWWTGNKLLLLLVVSILLVFLWFFCSGFSLGPDAVEEHFFLNIFCTKRALQLPPHWWRVTCFPSSPYSPNLLHTHSAPSYPTPPCSSLHLNTSAPPVQDLSVLPVPLPPANEEFVLLMSPWSPDLVLLLSQSRIRWKQKKHTILFSY